MVMIQSIVTFIVILFAGLVSVAQSVHAGQAAAGDKKKAWVIEQLLAVLNSPPPTLPGVSPIVMTCLLSVLRFLAPTVGAMAIDWMVARMNANSFFVAIETCLSEVLDSLTSGATTTPAALPEN